jgi:hypothetical protein
LLHGAYQGANNPTLPELQAANRCVHLVKRVAIQHRSGKEDQFARHHSQFETGGIKIQLIVQRKTANIWHFGRVKVQHNWHRPQHTTVGKTHRVDNTAKFN